MTPVQRAVLGVLGSAVVVVGVVAVLLVRDAGTSPEAAEATTTTSSPTSTTSSVSTASSTTTTSTTSTTTVPTTTTSSSSTTTTTTIPAEDLLVLHPDGLGGWDFGTDAEIVATALADLLGSPDDDTGWVDQREQYGICLGDEVRFVRWGRLQVFFTDGPSDWAPGGFRHVAAYTVGTFWDGEPDDLSTEDGVRLGTPVGDVRARYGSESVFDDPVYGPVFTYDPDGPGLLWGSLTGLEGDDVVETINGSFACGE